MYRIVDHSSRRVKNNDYLLLIKPDLNGFAAFYDTFFYM